jgi:hypothetical protein
MTLLKRKAKPREVTIGGKQYEIPVGPTVEEMQGLLADLDKMLTLIDVKRRQEDTVGVDFRLHGMRTVLAHLQEQRAAAHNNLATVRAKCRDETEARQNLAAVERECAEVERALWWAKLRRDFSCSCLEFALPQTTFSFKRNPATLTSLRTEVKERFAEMENEK